MLKRDKVFFDIIWCVFALFLLIIHQSVFMHFDDFGYASLSYGYTNNSKGMDWGILDLFQFLIWHYFNWGGRCLFFSFLCIFLRFGERTIQFINAFVIFGICYTSYYLVKRKDYDISAAIITIAFFFSIGLAAITDGVFWYTAAVLYVWPYLPLLIAVIMMKNNKKDHFHSIVTSFCFFMAGFSQEQTSILVIAMLTVLIFIFFKKNIRSGKEYCISITGGYIGALLELLAPGNYVRAAENVNNMPFYVKIGYNILNIFKILFGNDNLLLTMFLLLSSMGLGFLFFNQYKKRMIIYLNLASTIGMISTYFSDIEQLNLLIRILFCLLFFSEMTWFFIKQEKYIFFALLIGAVCSQAMLIVSPYIVARSTLPFQFIIHILCSYVLLESIRTEHRVKFAIFSLFLIIGATINFIYICLGYLANQEVNIINRSKLAEKKQLIKNGQNIDSIILYRLPDDTFSTVMPYQKDFVEYWIKNYYELPQYVNFIWNEFDKQNNSFEVVESLEPKIDSIWPDSIDAQTKRTDDGGIDFAVIPEKMDTNLVIIVNGCELATTIDNGFISAHLTKDFLDKDLEIVIFDKESQQLSDPFIMSVSN